MEIEVSIGEILDKITILSIKNSTITDRDKLNNIKKELNHLVQKCYSSGIELSTDLYFGLHDVNKQLWDIEDKIREKERRKEFDAEFIELARSVYMINDRRSEIKKAINLEYKSSFVEEKSYSKYN